MQMLIFIHVLLNGFYILQYVFIKLIGGMTSV